MANKRMFTMKIVDSDAFLEMPLSAQCLYFHLNMRADDDGFVDNPKRIARFIGASNDDLKLLIMKRFLLCFEDGVIVIKHWRMHNTLSKGRYHETQYIDEKKMLKIKENGAYSLDAGTPIDDSKLIGMFNSGEQVENKRRTNGEQVENADKDLGLGLGLDLGLDINIKEKDKSSFHSDLSKKKVAPKVDVDALCQTYNVTGLLREALDNWLAYKRERNFTYKETGLKNLLKRIEAKAMSFGDNAVIDAIEMSISNGYQGIVWDRIKSQKSNDMGDIDWSKV